MEFLSFDNGVIKNPFYRQDLFDDDDSCSNRRKWRRQPRDAFNNAAPAYMRNLLSRDKIPFQCSPAAICFTDYDVGMEHKVTVAFTNTATAPKTFRVMPILPRYANVVSVDYVLPPRISPGLSWNVTVKYRPHDNIDISTAIYVKTEEGYFAVPLSSSKKAFVFSVEPKSVNFGTVVVGEKRSKRITLRNSGALPGIVTVGGDFKSLLEQKHTHPVDGKKVFFFRITPQEYKIAIPPFSKSELLVSFAPLNPTQINTEILFTEKNNLNPFHTIPIIGSSTDLPVFLTTSNLDFGACFYGESYWDEVSIVNKTHIAAVADFQVPASMAGAIDVSPSRVCVQSGEEYNVRIVFTPSRDLPQDFSAAINCTVQDQTLTFTLNIVGILSHRAPRLPLTSFDVGVIPLHTIESVHVPVTNEASVKQMVGFDNLPRWVTATPEVLDLVPNETAKFILKIEAPQEGRFSQRLRMTNEFGDAHWITLSGEGTRPLVALSARTLLLPPCNIGRTVSGTTVISNTDEKPIKFSFSVPCSCFRVSPNAGVLQPGESLVVAILFDAPMEYEHVEPQQLATTPQRSSRQKKDLSVGFATESQQLQKSLIYNDWESGSEKEHWSKHKQFRIQCCLNDLDDECCYILVRCCAVKPPVGIEETEKAPIVVPTKKKKPSENETSQSPSKNSTLPEKDESDSQKNYKGEVFIEFGKVPIHHASILSCKICNIGEEPCTIRAPPLNPFSSFSVMSVAFDDIPPRAEVEIPISFHPHVYGKFSEAIKVELVMPNGAVAFVFVNVQGTCNSTQLVITSAEGVPPQDIASAVSIRHVAFDCTRKGEFTRKGLHLHNVGSFPLDIEVGGSAKEDGSLHTVGNAVHIDVNNTLPFLVHPRIFTLQPNTKQVMDIVFAPSDAGVYSERLNIAASGEICELVLEGRSVSSGIYCFVPIPELKTGKPTAVSFEGEIGCRPHYPVSLHFSEEESKILTIGNLLKGSTVEYEVQNWDQTRVLEMAAGWSVTPLLQTVLNGKEARLCVQRTFSEEEEGESAPSNVNSLSPFRFTIVLKGEGAQTLPYRVLYIVCTD